jgi:hypothetical protein
MFQSYASNTKENQMNGDNKLSKIANVKFAGLKLIVALASFTSAGMITTVKIPNGITSYDSNWSYTDFVIPENVYVENIFGGFSRTGYSVSEQDYQIQYKPGINPSFSSLSDSQVLNYDTINTSMYNTAINIREKNIVGPGIIRVSLPTGRGAIWDSAYIQYSNINCRPRPSGVASYDNNWNYIDFGIPAGVKVFSTFGGFNRPGYSTSEMDYIVQFAAGNDSITSLTKNQAFNYDLIDSSLYEKWTSISGSNFVGNGYIRISAPTGRGAIWDSACVEISDNVSAGIISRKYVHKVQPKQTIEFIDNRLQFNVKITGRLIR